MSESIAVKVPTSVPIDTSSSMEVDEDEPDPPWNAIDEFPTWVKVWMVYPPLCVIVPPVAIGFPWYLIITIPFAPLPPIRLVPPSPPLPVLPVSFEAAKGSARSARSTVSSGSIND